jgi:hypothetical protein
MERATAVECREELLYWWQSAGVVVVVVAVAGIQVPRVGLGGLEVEVCP